MIEEHETAYKSEQSPKYHARETAVHILEKPCLHRWCLVPLHLHLKVTTERNKGLYQLIKLDKRATGANLPNIYVEDLRKELNEGNRSHIIKKACSND